MEGAARVYGQGRVRNPSTFFFLNFFSVGDEGEKVEWARLVKGLGKEVGEGGRMLGWGGRLSVSAGGRGSSGLCPSGKALLAACLRRGVARAVRAGSVVTPIADGNPWGGAWDEQRVGCRAKAGETPSPCSAH